MRRPALALLLALAPLASHAAGAAKPKAPVSKSTKPSKGKKAPAPATAEQTPAPLAAKSEAPKPEATAPTTRYLDGLGRTPAQEQLLRDVSRALEAYEQESRDFHREVKELVKRRYTQRRAALSGSYEKTLTSLESQ
jgi:cellulose synthase operon protein C